MTPNAPERRLRCLCKLLICKGLFGGPDRDRTDDLFHAIKPKHKLFNYLQDPGGCLSPCKHVVAGEPAYRKTYRVQFSKTKHVKFYRKKT
jgi:hypothetical protein